VRRWILYALTTGVLISTAPSVVHASSAGRRNTAIATTAVAVGAWSNGTGRAGRRNTALLATGGAAYAWHRYNQKKKQERRIVRRGPARVVYVKSHDAKQWTPPGHRCDGPGRKLGHHKHCCHKHHKHDPHFACRR
jgi:ABC-type nickel/cobalt efflux system permease component RcnA